MGDQTRRSVEPPFSRPETGSNDAFAKSIGSDSAESDDFLALQQFAREGIPTPFLPDRSSGCPDQRLSELGCRILHRHLKVQ